MTEKVLLNSGYKQYDVPVWKNCDRFYQKKINDKKYFNVYYYDTFKENGALNYKFEYEFVEDRDKYWYHTEIWALDKDYPYTIEEIEELLLKENWTPININIDLQNSEHLTGKHIQAIYKQIEELGWK